MLMHGAGVHRQRRAQRAAAGTGNGDKVRDCDILLVIYTPVHRVKAAGLTDTQ